MTSAESGAPCSFPAPIAAGGCLCCDTLHSSKRGKTMHTKVRAGMMTSHNAPPSSVSSTARSACREKASLRCMGGQHAGRCWKQGESEPCRE